jgi:hypothetical protein
MALLLGISGTARAQQRACTASEARRAGSIVGAQRRWSDIYRSFQEFGHCDDGEIAEGFSEDVCRTLADRWDSVMELQRLASRDRSLKAFVLRHIDWTCDPSALHRLAENAAARCPGKAKAICAAILTRSRELEHEDVIEGRQESKRRPTSGCS